MTDTPYTHCGTRFTFDYWALKHGWYLVKEYETTPGWPHQRWVIPSGGIVCVAYDNTLKIMSMEIMP